MTLPLSTHPFPTNGIITHQFLEDNPKAVFVFGDNLLGYGKGGAAKFRDHPQAIGFITKRAPNNKDISFFTPKDYRIIFDRELSKLINIISNSSNHIFYISMLGAGLANRFKIFEEIIEPNLKSSLKSYSNVVFLW